MQVLPMMTPRRRSHRFPYRSLAAAVLLTAAIGVLDRWTGYEVSVLMLYLLPSGLAGWYAGRRGAVGLSLLGAAVWLWADVGAGHTYSHPGIPYWNAAGRLTIFAAFGLLVAELRTARQRAVRSPDAGDLPAAESFYRMLEQEYNRLLQHGRPVTLAYVDAGTARGEGGASLEVFSAAVLEVLRTTLRGSDVVARPRGKEFALLLADTGPDAAGVAMRRLHGALSALAQRHGAPFSVAVGAVSCAGPAGDLNHVIQRAYQLMYQAERTPGHAALAVEPCATDAEPAHAAS
jgi:hypothetical protein